MLKISSGSSNMMEVDRREGRRPSLMFASMMVVVAERIYKMRPSGPHYC